MERQIHAELFRITPDGELQEVGYITYQFEPETFFVGLTNQAVYAHQAQQMRHPLSERTGSYWEQHDQLPWWLADSLPSGYMGLPVRRAFGKAWPDVDLSSNLGAMRYLTDPRFGLDLPGIFLLGRACADAWLQRQQRRTFSIDGEEGRKRFYPILARRAERGRQMRAPVSGKSPKFSAVVDGKPHFVKFARIGSWEGQMLLCETWAMKGMNSIVTAKTDRSVLPSATTELYESEGYFFLESERFDRTPEGGRRGVVSLRALYDGLVSKRGGEPMDSDHWFGTDKPVDSSCLNWSDMARALNRKGVIDAKTLVLIEEGFRYGELIRNVNMHAGNLSFMLTDTFPLQLAPFYDMLPCAYTHGVMPDDLDWSPRESDEVPVDDLIPMILACALWSTIRCASASISQPLREAAARHYQVVNAMLKNPT